MAIVWETEVKFIDRLEVDRGWFVSTQQKGFAPLDFLISHTAYGETNLSVGDKLKITIEKLTQTRT